MFNSYRYSFDIADSNLAIKDGFSFKKIHVKILA